MVRRRQVLSFAAGAGSALAARRVSAETPDELLKYLCPPDGLPDPLSVAPSPYAEPFAAELFIPPIKQPVAALNPSADPRAHQLFDKHASKKFYEIREQEFQWQYHPHQPYANGTLGWGFDYMTPGADLHGSLRRAGPGPNDQRPAAGGNLEGHIRFAFHDHSPAQWAHRFRERRQPAGLD